MIEESPDFMIISTRLPSFGKSGLLHAEKPRLPLAVDEGI